MWEGLFILLGLSILMAVASFLAGSLPLSFSLTQRQLRLISTLGTGVLVGTALIVIIPEGIETLYSSTSISHISEPGQPPEPVVDTTIKGGLAALGLHGHPQPDFERRDARFEDAGLSPSPISVVSGSIRARAEDEHAHEQSPHAWIGLSLITGFILMYLIDTLPSLGPTPSLPPQHISLHNLGTPEPRSPVTCSQSSSTTIGLVIHAVADGIALGASTATPTTKTSLGLVVFMAIMLHKAPAAFGLTAVLLKQGLSKRSARAHLAVFSLAAPAGAIGTWILVNLLGRAGMGSGDSSNGVWRTGIVLIFSGGTFLYVAMHSIQHSSEGPDHPHMDGAYDGGLLGSYADQRTSKKTDVADIALMVVGMLLPLLTQIGHAHAHGE